MQIKGAAASHAANAMSAEAQSVGQVIQSVAADNAQIAVANTSAVGQTVLGLATMFAAPAALNSLSGLIHGAPVPPVSA